MSKVARTVGAVAGILSIVLLPINPGLAAVAGAVAAVANTVAVVTQKKPPMKGSVSQIMIGATMPVPYLMGRSYVGGMQVYDNSAGAKNAWRFQVMAVSGAGPIEGFETFLTDYAATGLTVSGAATGWFSGFLDVEQKLGARPETAHASTGTLMPSWGAAHRISGYASYRVKMKFDKDGKRFASGVPQLGVVAKGVKIYDPRLDSTYPGGSGAHRWDDEATWAWSDNPSLHALTYARGRFANGVKILGAGIPRDAIDVASFVELANICEANEWTLGGLIYEAPDLSKWDNLKRILQAGGAKPVWAGGMLRLRISAPRPSLFDITVDDLTDGVDVKAMKGWRDRRNSIVPKYRSEQSKWEYIQGDAVTASTYLAEDGELKTEEVQFDLVQDKDQAAQLAAYEMVNGREFGPITLTVKPRLLTYRVGEAGTLHIPEAGLFEQLAVIIGRSVDPANGTVTLTLESETTAKHAYALGRTGTAPPTPVIRTSQELDEVVSEEGVASTTRLIADSGPRGLSVEIDTAGVVTVSNHERVYADKVMSVTGATVTPWPAAVAGDSVGVFYDDEARAGGAVTYQYEVIVGSAGEIDHLYPSVENPFRHFVTLLQVPATGTVEGGSGIGPGTGGTGGGIGGGGSGPRTVEV